MNYYYLIGIISFIISVCADFFVNSRFKKYNSLSCNLSGFEACRKMLDANGLSDIYIVSINGHLTDHYDSDARVIRLSKEVFNGNSISAVAVACHEAGHAIQHKEGNTLINLRKFIFPLVNFSTKFGYIVLVLGLAFSMIQLFYAGIALMGFILVFQLITLPVEFDASRKALDNIKSLSLIDSNMIDGVWQVLVSAAFTYVASLITTILEVFRLLLIAGSRDDR